MQGVDLCFGDSEIFGLHLMHKVKNDPVRYQKRSDLVRKPRIRVRLSRASKKQREHALLTAEIDAGGYIDFRSAPSKERC
jgi:hypothetical protein